jgi:hypothetical protein
VCVRPLIIRLWKEPVAVMHQNYAHTMLYMRGFIQGRSSPILRTADEWLFFSRGKYAMNVLHFI